ncbi:MAG: glycosyltransferase [Acidimicrobiales bacterium]
MEPCLSVVMPCYNEAASVERVIHRVLASPYTAELIVVDDGSTDGSREILTRLDDPQVRLVFQPVNAGKGAALRAGFAQARFPYVIVQDADDEYDPADYAQIMAPLLDGRADVVFGSRFNAVHAHRVLYFWHSVGNRLLTTISNMFTNLNLTDMETCYKAFRLEVIEALEIEEDRFGFEPEITAKVAGAGWRVYEVSIGYAGRTYAEGKKIGWRDGVHALTCIVRYSGIGQSRRRRNVARPGAERGPVTAESTDDALSGTLDSLDDALNYAGWIYSAMQPHLGSRVLEIGAGHGTLTDLLADGREVVVTDVSPRCVAVLRQRFSDRSGVEVLEADVLATPDIGGFDSIVMVNVLEHVADDKAALRHLRKALHPGGRLLLFVPAFEELYSDFDRRIGHHRRYRAPALSAAVTEAGFEVLDARYVNSVGAVAWWVIARQLGRVPTKRWSALTYDKAVVPVLRKVESRWTPPFGQSVLCVARRPD